MWKKNRNDKITETLHQECAMYLIGHCCPVQCVATRVVAWLNIFFFFPQLTIKHVSSKWMRLWFHDIQLLQTLYWDSSSSVSISGTMYLVLGSSSMIGVTVTLWQSCQPAAAPLYAYQCSAVQTVDLSWHRGSRGWVTGSDIRSASGISVPALPWQLPASHTATASPWLPPHLDTTPGKLKQKERDRDKWSR